MTQLDEAQERIKLNRAIEIGRKLDAEDGGYPPPAQTLEEGVIHAMHVLEGAPDINPSNYEHGQVCDLNTASNHAWEILNTALEACATPSPHPLELTEEEVALVHTGPASQIQTEADGVGACTVEDCTSSLPTCPVCCQVLAEALAALKTLRKIVGDYRNDNSLNILRPGGGYMFGDVMNDALGATDAILAKAQERTKP